jgi:hypothetical protein
MAAVRVTVDQSKFKPLPEGRYEGFLSDPEIAPAKEEGKFPSLTFFFCTDDPALGEKKIKVWYSFSPKATFRMLALFERLEIPHEIEKDEDDNDVIIFDPEDLAGKSVLAQLSIQNWEAVKDGKKKSGVQNKVEEFYLPI